jgi:hypothetical protein
MRQLTLRTQEIQSLLEDSKLPFRWFSPSHLRIYGVVTIDYWPNTGRAWILGSDEKAQRRNPAEVVERAKHLESLSVGDPASSSPQRQSHAPKGREKLLRHAGVFVPDALVRQPASVEELVDWDV